LVRGGIESDSAETFPPVELRKIEVPHGIGLELPRLLLSVCDSKKIVCVISPHLIRVVTVLGVVSLTGAVGIVES